MFSIKQLLGEKKGEHDRIYLASFKLRDPFIQEQLYTRKSVL